MSSSSAGTSDAATPGKASSWGRRHRRSLLAASLLLAIAVLAGATTASWYFSDAVVVPDHRIWPIDTTVRSVSGDSVTLSGSEASMRPGVYGLDWRGGHALVESVIHADAHTVTRQLSDVQGRLAAGTKAAIDADAYKGNPLQALGLPFSDVEVPGELGQMPAWLILAPSRPGGRRVRAAGLPATPARAVGPSKAADSPAASPIWAIVVHGINGSRQDDLRVATALHAADLPTLLITYREDAGAPPSPDGKHHMGLTEWRDLQAAAHYALGHGARRLVLVGQSMGGAIVTQFMERSSLAHAVAGLILDAPALDWKAILSFNAKEMGLPSFAAIPVEWMIGERIHAEWSRLDALRHTADLHMPILLFHGMADRLVPISTSDEFAAKLRRWITYYRVPGAAHVQSWNIDPRLYDRRVEDFLAGIHV